MCKGGVSVHRWVCMGGAVQGQVTYNIDTPI